METSDDIQTILRASVDDVRKLINLHIDLIKAEVYAASQATKRVAIAVCVLIAALIPALVLLALSLSGWLASTTQMPAYLCQGLVAILCLGCGLILFYLLVPKALKERF